MRVKISRALRYSDETYWLEFRGVENPNMITRMNVSEPAAFGSQMMVDGFQMQTVSIYSFIQKVVPFSKARISEVELKPVLPPENVAQTLGINYQDFVNVYREKHITWTADIHLETEKDKVVLDARPIEAIWFLPESIKISDEYLHPLSESEKAILPPGYPRTSSGLSPLTCNPVDCSFIVNGYQHKQRITRRGRPVKVADVGVCRYQKINEQENIDLGVMVFETSRGQVPVVIDFQQYEDYRLAKANERIEVYGRPPAHLLAKQMLDYLGLTFERMTNSVGFRVVSSGLPFYDDSDGPVKIRSSDGRVMTTRMRPTDAFCLGEWGADIEAYVCSALIVPKLKFWDSGVAPGEEEIKSGVLVKQYVPARADYII